MDVEAGARAATRAGGGAWGRSHVSLGATLPTPGFGTSGL